MIFRKSSLKNWHKFTKFWLKIWTVTEDYCHYNGKTLLWKEGIKKFTFFLKISHLYIMNSWMNAWYLLPIELSFPKWPISGPCPICFSVYGGAKVWGAANGWQKLWFAVNVWENVCACGTYLDKFMLVWLQWHQFHGCS